MRSVSLARHLLNADWPLDPLSPGGGAILGSGTGHACRTEKMQDQVRRILAQNGRLAVSVDSLAEDADLFAAGLDSLAIVNVLMSIEEHFDIELPDELLSRRTFASIGAITRVVSDLTPRAGNV